MVREFFDSLAEGVGGFLAAVGSFVRDVLLEVARGTISAVVVALGGAFLVVDYLRPTDVPLGQMSLLGETALHATSLSTVGIALLATVVAVESLRVAGGWRR